MPALAQHVTGVVEFSHNSLIQSIMEYVSMPGQINFIRGPAGIGKTLALAIAASCVQKQKRFLVYFEDARSPYHLYSDGKDRPTLYKQEFLYRVAKRNAHVWDEYIGSDIDRRQLQKKKDGYNVNEIYAAVVEKLIAAQANGKRVVTIVDDFQALVSFLVSLKLDEHGIRCDNMMLLCSKRSDFQHYPDSHGGCVGALSLQIY